MLDDWAAEQLRAEAARQVASMVDGRHYTTYVAEVKQLRKAGDDDAAAGLLLRLIDAIEREVKHPLAGHDFVPPVYFHQLEAIYEKRGMAREAALLRQKYNMLMVEAETQGRIAKMKMDAAVVAELADDTGPSHIRIVVRQMPAKPKRRAPSAAQQVAHAAGKAMGALARLLKLR